MSEVEANLYAIGSGRLQEKGSRPTELLQSGCKTSVGLIRQVLAPEGEVQWAAVAHAQAVEHDARIEQAVAIDLGQPATLFGDDEAGDVRKLLRAALAPEAGAPSATPR